MGHAAGHAAEQFELLGDQQFVLEPDLIEDEAEVFGELEQQVEVQRRVGFVIGFFTQQENAEGLLVEDHGEAELGGERLQLAPRLAFGLRFVGIGEGFVDGEIIRPTLSEQLEDAQGAGQFPSCFAFSSGRDTNSDAARVASSSRMIW